MKLKTWHIVVGIILIAGAAAGAWVHRDVIAAVIEGRHTDEITRKISDDQSVAVAYIEAKNEIVRTEVRTIYVETKSKVMALPPDSVARELNAELAMWRGLEGGAGGVDRD